MREAFLIVGLLGLSACSRPGTSEITPQEFASRCLSGSKLTDDCDGRFVRWSGMIQQPSDDEIRIRIDGTNEDVYLQLEPTKGEDVEGRKVKFSGYLGKSSFLKMPIIENAVIDQYMNSASQAKSDYLKPAADQITDEEVMRMGMCREAKTMAEKEALRCAEIFGQ